jgi:hypothetical protein
MLFLSFGFGNKWMKSIVNKIEQVHGGMARAPHLERMHIIFSPKIEHCFLGIIGPRILNHSQLTSPSN